MSKIFTCILVTILSFTLISNIAFAKRFGGGKSFGQQRSYSAPHNSTNTASKASAASKSNKWLGPLAGLAVGGLLASLFMGHGLGASMLSWLLIAVVIFIAFRVISYLRSQNTQNNMSFDAQQGRTISNVDYQPKQDMSFNDTGSNFDKDDFLRQAKATFIRMQAAYDNKNLNDIREFTTPEVFAEIQLQIQERGNENNVTEILHVSAELVGNIYDINQTKSSINFKGSLKEKVDAEPENIDEVWHFEKDTFSNNWRVSGLQQNVSL